MSTSQQKAQALTTIVTALAEELQNAGHRMAQEQYGSKATIFDEDEHARQFVVELVEFLLQSRLDVSHQPLMVCQLTEAHAFAWYGLEPPVKR